MQKINGKYRTQLNCINCGGKFGDFTILKASETLPICNECRETRTPYKYLKLGNSITDHFVLEIIPKQKKGRIMLVDRNDLVKYKYEFGEESIKIIKEYLEMIK